MDLGTVEVHNNLLSRLDSDRHDDTMRRDRDSPVPVYSVNETK